MLGYESYALLQSIEDLGDQTESVGDKVEEQLSNEVQTGTDDYLSGVAEEAQTAIQKLIEATTPASENEMPSLTSDAQTFLERAEQFYDKGTKNRTEGKHDLDII